MPDMWNEIKRGNSSESKRKFIAERLSSSLIPEERKLPKTSFGKTEFLIKEYKNDISDWIIKATKRELFPYFIIK